MRCPNCGAFLEQGKVVCNMCGTNSTTYVPQQTTNTNNDSMFSTGMNTGNGDFSSAPPPVTNKYANISTKKDYHNVELVPVKNGEKDIFDFFSENKKLLSLLGILLVFGLIALAGWGYYKHKSKTPEIIPVMRHLYYNVDSSFELVDDSENKKFYSRSGSKGNDCSITITYGTGTSGDHVRDYFAEVHKKLEPEKDNNGNVLDEMDIYTPEELEITINKDTWHSMKIKYKYNLNDTEARNLKYLYLTSMYKGYFYDIELVNNSNDAICARALDVFSGTLKFIDTKTKE